MSYPAKQQQRDDMLKYQISDRGVHCKYTLAAIKKVPREKFLPNHLRRFAYQDCPLPIDAEQTISQPYIVALMTEALALVGGERVLEIGTGSGYAAAILAEIAGQVYSVECIAQLAQQSRDVLAQLGYTNIKIRHADGTQGWPEHAPYDAIVVTAGGPAVPESLKTQLKIGGRLVIPVGSSERLQKLICVIKLSETEFITEELADVRFVPLVGKEGWAD